MDKNCKLLTRYQLIFAFLPKKSKLDWQGGGEDWRFSGDHRPTLALRMGPAQSSSVTARGWRLLEDGREVKKYPSSSSSFPGRARELVVVKSRRKKTGFGLVGVGFNVGLCSSWLPRGWNEGDLASDVVGLMPNCHSWWVSTFFFGAEVRARGGKSE